MDQSSNQEMLMTPEEAVKIIFLAKQAENPKFFELFQKNINDEKIPWSLTDPRFLKKIQELKISLVGEFGLQNEALVQKAAEESYTHTLSQDEREGMEKGLATIREKTKTHHNDIFVHTESLVDSYVKQLKDKGVEISDQQKSVIHETIAQSVITKGTDDLSKQFVQAATSANIPIEEATILTPLELSPDVTRSLEELSSLSAVTQTALTSSDTIHKGALIEQCLLDPNTPPTVIADKYRGELEIEKAFVLPDDVATETNNQLTSDIKRGAAFQQAATNTKTGIAKPIGDVVTAIAGPDGKNFISDVIATVVGPSVKDAKENGAVGGKLLKTNAWTNEKIQQMEGWVAQNEERQRGAQKIVQTTTRQALIASAVEVYGPKIQEGLVVYLESATVKVHTNAPAFFQFIMLSGTDIWNIILGKATTQVSQAAVKKVGAEFLKVGIGQGAKAAGQAAAGTTAAAAGLTAGGPVGAVIGFIGSQIVGKALSFIGNGIRGIFSFFQFGEVARSISESMGAPSKPKPWYKKDDVVIAILLIIGVFVISGFTFIREVSTTAAIVAEKDKGDQYTGRGEPHTAPPGSTSWSSSGKQRQKTISQLPPTNYCKNNPSNPMCQIKSCPEGQVCVFPILNGSCSNITQGPASSFTHKGEWGNAVDFGSPMYTPIFSLMDGVVVQNDHWSFNKYKDDTAEIGNPDGNYVGNSVVVEAPDGTQVVYGHLAFDSMPPVGTQITKGQTVIGQIGETGSSDGAHVHVGVIKGDINITELLPPCPLPG